MYLSQRLVLLGALLGGLILGWLLYTTSTAVFSIRVDSDNPTKITQHDSLENSTGSSDSPGVASNNENISLQPAQCEVSHQFPAEVLRWCELITHYARKNNLPADLIAALVWLESGGNPQAYSSAGAVGLMQVMPRDGRAASLTCQNGPCFANRPTTAELKDPEFNLSYGTKMLARLLKIKGDLREALKSYGPMDVGYYYADKVLSLYKQYGN